VQLPSWFKVGAGDGMTVRQDASPAARAFAPALLAPEGQAVFARFGFGTP